METRSMLTLRNVMFVMAAIGATIMLLYTVARLENRAGHASAPPEGADYVFKTELPPEKAGGDILIHCSEERFGDAFQEFRKFLAIEEVPLSIPGGPMVLALADVETIDELKPAQRALVEVLKRHTPERVVLVAHEECLSYDAIAAWHDELDTVRAREEKDLLSAKRVIETWFPNAKVEIYFADKEGDMLFFRRVDPDRIAAPSAAELLPDGVERSEPRQ